MENKDGEAGKYKVAIFVAAACVMIMGVVLSLIMRDVSSPVDMKGVFTRKPGGPVVLAGFLLVVLSAATLVFRNQMGSWVTGFRRWLADFFPNWKRLSGLPDDQVEQYLTREFSRKMVVVGAAIDLCVGLCLIGVGCALNMAP